MPDALNCRRDPSQPWDTHLVIYTSGTTGPSKGVLSSHLHSLTSARDFRHVDGRGSRLHRTADVSCRRSLRGAVVVDSRHPGNHGRVVQDNGILGADRTRIA